MSEAWHRVGSRAALEEGRPLEARVGGRDICVHLSDGRLFAIDDECPHSFAPLSAGQVEGDAITCPLHRAVFHLGTGKCLEGALGGDPGEIDDLRTYPVTVEGDDVLISV